MQEVDIHIIVDKKISAEKNERRYVVINSRTGEVIDDGCSHGYRTKKGALTSYLHKLKGAV